MSRQINIGLVAEGNTDEDFLLSLIERTYQALILDCTQMVEVLSPRREPHPRTQLTEYLRSAARNFHYYDILCIHCDADNRNDTKFRQEVLEPAMNSYHELRSNEEKIASCVVPIVPVRTLENWMLADTALLKFEISTDLSNRTLGLHYPPESYNDPKATIKQAITISAARRPGRGQKIELRSLYEPIGRGANLDQLLKLPSFQKFYEAARQSLVQLGLIQPE